MRSLSLACFLADTLADIAGTNNDEIDTPSHNREYFKYGSGCEHRKFQNHIKVLSHTDFPSW
jgi:hypothetical protein